jgi:Glyoxalase-like domain
VSGVALDHAGVVTRDLVALAQQYERLGFALTPIARQADGRIGNRCVMLRYGYIELLAVVDPNAGSATLARFLARYVGVHILAFAIDDTQAVLERLRGGDASLSSVVEFERAIDDADPSGPRARFALIRVPDQPEGRINLVRHLTPELLWQERFLRH